MYVYVFLKTRETVTNIGGVVVTCVARGYTDGNVIKQINI
jgi:hypothetical protein